MRRNQTLMFMNSQQNQTVAPASRQVFDLVNLFLVDALSEMVSLLHPHKTAVLAPGMDGQDALQLEALSRARIRLDGARTIFELLTRPNIEEVARKQAVGCVMENILASRPKNCPDDAPHQRQFAKIFGTDNN